MQEYECELYIFLWTSYGHISMKLQWTFMYKFSIQSFYFVLIKLNLALLIEAKMCIREKL